MAIPTGLTNAATDTRSSRSAEGSAKASVKTSTKASTKASAASPEGDEDVTAAAYLFRTLGDPTRLLILRHLARGEHRVVDLMTHLGLAQSTVSGHLACLRDCGLVRSRAQGRASLYSLARPELLDLFGATESFLEATGERVVLHHTAVSARTGHEHGAHEAHAYEAASEGEHPRARLHHRTHRPGIELGHEAAEHPA